MNISQNLNHIRQLINQSELENNRKPGSVLLLAVSKSQNIDAIAEVFQLGVRDFGENYYQGALDKINTLKSSQRQLKGRAV